MKREFLTELFKKHNIEVPKEAVDAIMDENGKDLETSKKDLDKAKTDLAAEQTKAKELGDQIKKRDTDIAELQKQTATSDETKKALTDLQAKYDADTKTLQETLDNQKKEAEKQLQEQALSHATEAFFKDLPFASELARKAAISDFKAAGLKLDDSGKFLGADDWVKQLRETDPAAFKPEDDNAANNGGGANRSPYFVAPSSNNGGNSGPDGGDKSGFNFSNRFTRLRQPPSTNQNHN